jgi:hypothetical protein
VVPVTVRGARLFAETNLPESVRTLAGAQALDLREDAWAADVGLIADRLFPSRKPNAPLIAEPEPPPRPNTLREPRASGSPPDVRERAIMFAQAVLRLAEEALDTGNLDRAAAVLRQINLDAPELRSRREIATDRVRPLLHARTERHTTDGSGNDSEPHRPGNQAPVAGNACTSERAGIAIHESPLPEWDQRPP